MADHRFDKWMEELEAKQLANLTFPEVSRALRALSSAYVERRNRLSQGAALSGSGKRAAFALFYGPLHYLLIRHVAASLPGCSTATTIVDLGCGTGASGAGWASGCASSPTILGIDRHPWAVSEAQHTYRAFGLSGRARVGDAALTPLPRGSAVLVAFTVNELDDQGRGTLLPKLLEHAQHGGRVLVVEPLAGFVAPWWKQWQHLFEQAGGRGDEWRVRPELPAIVQKLDRAAGLNHREITGRSLWLAAD
jgi:hypothetical protein